MKQTRLSKLNRMSLKKCNNTKVRMKKAFLQALMKLNWNETRLINGNAEITKKLSKSCSKEVIITIASSK